MTGIVLDTIFGPMRLRLRGPDVSSFQGVPRWRIVKQSHDFAICKATEGLTYVDPDFDYNWKQLKHNGLVRGAYHFARPQPGRSATAEAEHFLSTVARAGGFRPGDLRPVLDIEWSQGLGFAELQPWVSAFVHHVKAQVGVMPIIYTGSWWRDHGLVHNYGCPLWLAAYVRFPFLYVPHPWRRWSIWQYTDHAAVGGIVGACDFNKVRSRRAFRELRIP